MIDATTKPADPVYVLKKLQPGETLRVLALSQRWVATATHFLDRSICCPGTEICPLCLRGEPTNFTAILPVKVKGGQTQLLNVTQGLADSIGNQLRGMDLLHRILTIKHRNRFTGAVLIANELHEGPKPEEWTERMIRAQLARILRLPPQRQDESDSNWRSRCLQTALNEIERKLHQ